ncbi:hypothetical protein [Naasia aerilata]|uniref:hypothetical protein n=1 Tax=Naasia aerilata TaxID=1162966 RepID=UPI00257429EA|nr:hypothetical protein [Naasia aerilata]
MAHTWLRFEDESYPLPEDADLDALKASIEEAARSGDRWVEFAAEDGREVRLFVTRKALLVFESSDRSNRAAPEPDLPDVAAGFYDEL